MLTMAGSDNGKPLDYRELEVDTGGFEDETRPRRGGGEGR